MSNRERSVRVVALALALFTQTASAQQPPARVSSAASPSRAQILETMKRATAFMVEKVSTNGGYVWSYLPDFSRRWGEMEAFETTIWIQPPGTATMGHLFFDAYHATADEYYYQAAEKVAAALIWAQHPSGGWNYIADFAGEPSLRKWYDTIGKNGWRLEEFQHYWGNATFDDAGTAESAKLLLRLYLEKRDPRFKPALDKAIQFVLDSQYPDRRLAATLSTAVRVRQARQAGLHVVHDVQRRRSGGEHRFPDHVLPDARRPPRAGCDHARDERVSDHAARPAAARVGAAVHDRSQALGGTLLRTERTGHAYDCLESRTAAPLPSADRRHQISRAYPRSARLAASRGVSAGRGSRGRTHPTFIEIGTNKPLYVHREGSNVVNGRYFVDDNSRKTLGHYSAFRRVDVAGLRAKYTQAKALAPAEVTKGSPLAPDAKPDPLPRFFVASDASGARPAAEVLSTLDERGFWLAPLGYNSHPYKSDGAKTPAPGDFSQTHVGDETDTSPYPDDNLMGISIAAYLRNMGVLIRALASRD